MAGIHDYREQYPQYNDLSDDELTYAIYQSDPTLADEMEFEEFSERFRGTPIVAEEQPTATIEEKIDGTLQTPQDPLSDS